MRMCIAPIEILLNMSSKHFEHHERSWRAPRVALFKNSTLDHSSLLPFEELERCIISKQAGQNELRRLQG